MHTGSIHTSCLGFLEADDVSFKAIQEASQILSGHTPERCPETIDVPGHDLHGLVHTAHACRLGAKKRCCHPQSFLALLGNFAPLVCLALLKTVEMITNPENLPKDRLKAELKKKGISFNTNENKKYYVDLYRKKILNPELARSEFSDDDVSRSPVLKKSSPKKVPAPFFSVIYESSYIPF